jgi:hypothetical protein
MGDHGGVISVRSTNRMRPASILALVGLGLGAISAMALPAVASPHGHPAEARVYPHGVVKLPACHDAAVLGEVIGSFASREGTYWGGRLQLAGIDRVRETAFRPWGASFVPRRFCTARAHVSDGHLRRVNYLVREVHGAFGNSWEVTWCVVGLDRHRSYAPRCEQATPW